MYYPKLVVRFHGDSIDLSNNTSLMDFKDALVWAQKSSDGTLGDPDGAVSFSDVHGKDLELEYDEGSTVIGFRPEGHADALEEFIANSPTDIERDVKSIAYGDEILKVGEFVTVLEWLNCTDNSYKGDVLEILAVSYGTLIVKRHSNHSLMSWVMELSLTRVTIGKLSAEYVFENMPHFKMPDNFELKQSAEAEPTLKDRIIEAGKILGFTYDELGEDETPEQMLEDLYGQVSSDDVMAENKAAIKLFAKAEGLELALPEDETDQEKLVALVTKMGFDGIDMPNGLRIDLREHNVDLELETLGEFITRKLEESIKEDIQKDLEEMGHEMFSGEDVKSNPCPDCGSEQRRTMNDLNTVVYCCMSEFFKN